MLASLNDLIGFSSLDPNNYYFLDQYYLISLLKSNYLLHLKYRFYVNSLNESENSMVKQGSYKEFTDQEVSAYLGMVEDYKQVQSDMPGIYFSWKCRKIQKEWLENLQICGASMQMQRKKNILLRFDCYITFYQKLLRIILLSRAIIIYQ